MEYPFKDLLPLDEVLAREGYYKDWTHLDPEVFYSLTQISEYIKTKGYGVDVRLLIAQLAEHFGLKTTQVVDLANLLSTKHDALKAQFDVIIRDAASGTDWGGEIVLARGGKPTLQARLDDTTAQLNERVDQIIAHNGDGTKDTELIDARGTYPVLGQRIKDLEINTEIYRIIEENNFSLDGGVSDLSLNNTRTGTVDFTLFPTDNTTVLNNELVSKYVDSFTIKHSDGAQFISQNILSHLDKLGDFQNEIEHNKFVFKIRKRLERVFLKDLSFTYKSSASLDDGSKLTFHTSELADALINNSTNEPTHILCSLLPNKRYSDINVNKTDIEGVSIYNNTFALKISAATLGVTAEDTDGEKVLKLQDYLISENAILLYALENEKVSEITNTSFLLSEENMSLSIATANFKSQISVSIPLLLDIELLKEDLKTDVEKSRLAGKKIVCFGDSITDSSNYPELIASQTGATVYNVGFGGCMYQEHPRADYDAFGMHALATAIATDDWSYQDAGVQTVEPNFQPHLDTLKSIDFNTVDIITILYGTNDWRNGLLIGEPSIDNVDKTNLNGAINKSIQALLTAYPKLRIMLLSPPWRMLDYETDPRGSDVTLRGNPSRHLYNDVSMAIKDRAFDYKVAFFDLYKECGWNYWTKDLYTTDGTHPTAEGSKILAEKIAGKLVSTF